MPSLAATNPAQECVGTKLKAVAKLEKALLGCASKSQATGDASSFAACFTKADTKFRSAFGKATGCSGTADECSLVVTDCLVKVGMALPDSGPDNCEGAKTKAAGKRGAAQLLCYAKAAGKGMAVDAACLTKAADKFTLALAKAGGACTGDEATVAPLVDDECVAQVAGQNPVVTDVCATTGGGATCGNNVTEGSEQCDGTDAASCPGNCRVDCTCPSGGPSAPDLDVAYIERTPRYYRYDLDYRLQEGDPWPLPRLCAGTENLKRWPDVDEVVTYTAHVINKGESASATFAYKWRADGITVEQGMLGPLGAGEHAQASLQRRWPAEPESLQFVVEDDVEVESSETNNALAVGSHDLTLSIRVEQGLYDIFNRTVNVAGTRSFEDWIQGQIAKMNERFGQAVYPVSPAGILDRVRIDRILVEPDLDSRPPKFPCHLRDDAEENLIDGHWQFADGDPTNALGAAGAWQQYVNEFVWTIDWGLIHELTHQLGIIDLYRMNLRNDPALNNGFQVTDLNGDVIAASRLPNFGFDQLMFQFPGIMAGGSTEPYRNLTYFESHTAGGLNSHYNYRRGYFGEYLFDTPATTYLKVVDAEGTPLAGVAVQLYQKSLLSEDIDDIAEITGTTDGAGRLLLPNREVFEVQTATGHTLKPNPFGQIFHEGQNGTMFVRAIEQGQELYGWIFLLDLNLAYWQGVRAEAEILVTVVPPR